MVGAVLFNHKHWCYFELPFRISFLSREQGERDDTGRDTLYVLFSVPNNVTCVSARHQLPLSPKLAPEFSFSRCGELPPTTEHGISSEQSRVPFERKGWVGGKNYPKKRKNPTNINQRPRALHKLALYLAYPRPLACSKAESVSFFVFCCHLKVFMRWGDPGYSSPCPHGFPHNIVLAIISFLKILQ